MEPPVKPWLVIFSLLFTACEVEAIAFSSWDFFDDQQRIRTSGDAANAREEMIELVFGAPMPTRLPDDVVLTADSAFGDHRIHQITVDTDDLTSIAYLIHPASWNGALAIYHQGHEGDFRDRGTTTISGLLDAGFQVLAFSMPMRGMNTHPFGTSDHSELKARDHPLRYFIDPVIVALNWAEANQSYSRRFMVGLSGGGWTTVVVAAIDERIDASYPVAASWPHYLRDRYGSLGDYEQRIIPSYLELYLMATHPAREQVQIFNELDPCCFGGLFAYDYLTYTSYRANEWAGRFQILIDHGQAKHTISSYSLGQILGMELGR